jgi:hypothetical protein
MKRTTFFLMIVLYAAQALPFDNDRKGFVLGVELSPDFTYTYVSTSIGSQSGWYNDYLGGLAGELRLGYSRSGKNISSFISSFTWNYPTDRFNYSLFEGYAFSHYINESGPSLAYDFSMDIGIRHTNGVDVGIGSFGVRTACKVGFEFGRHFSVWLGERIFYQVDTYTIDRTTIDPNDLTNTIRDLGSQNVTENGFGNSVFITLGYTLY